MNMSSRNKWETVSLPFTMPSGGKMFQPAMPVASLPPSLAASVAAPLPTEKGKKKKSSRSFRAFVAACETNAGKDIPDPKRPPSAKYNFTMYNASKRETKLKVVSFWKMPVKISDIKEKIQNEFDIPKCFQVIYFRGKSVENEQTLSEIGLFSGDSLELNYLSEGEIEETKIALCWFTFISTFAKNRHPSIFTGVTSEIQLVVGMGLKEDLIQKFVQKQLLPWKSDVTYANRMFFMQQDGIQSVIQVYYLLTAEPWRTLPLNLKMVEPCCAMVLAALASTDVLRTKIINEDGIGCILQSFQRVHLRRNTPVIDTSGSTGRQEHNDLVLKELYDACLEFMLSFREEHEFHTDVCSKHSVVEQLVCIPQCPSFNIHQAQGAMCVLACCMTSPDTHKWLCRSGTLEGIADAVRIRRDFDKYDPLDLFLLQYYCHIIMGYLVLTSARHMSQRLYEKFIIYMEDFLEISHPDIIAVREKEFHPKFGWTSYMPFLKLLLSPPAEWSKYGGGSYLPRHLEPETMMVRKLHDLGLETALLGLEVMVSKDPEEARKKLLEEKILSYTLCLPANVPYRIRDRANAIVTKLRTYETKNPVMIPKLGIMAKARLAKVYFGLKKVMDRSADELSLEVKPSSVAGRTAAKGASSKGIYIIGVL